MRRVPAKTYNLLYSLVKAYLAGRPRQHFSLVNAVIERVLQEDDVVIQPYPVHTCPICGAEFSNTAGTMHHIVVVHGDYLDMVVVRAYELYNAVKSCIKPNGVGWRCVICGAELMDVREVVHHVLTQHIYNINIVVRVMI